MIMLNQKDHKTSYPLKFILPASDKRGLQQAVRMMGIQGCSRCNKDELCMIIEEMLTTDSLKWVLDILTDDEIEIVGKLVKAGPDTCVEVPMRRDDKFYRIQTMFLVVSYEDNANRIWRMFMPDEVRLNCAKYIDEYEDVTGEMYIPEEMEGRLDDWHRKALDSMDDFDFPEEFKEMVRDLPARELLRGLGFDFQKPVFNGLSDVVEIEFLPVMSLSSGMKFPKGQTWYHRVITKSAVLSTEKLGIGNNVQYMNLYFIRMESDLIKIAACFGDVINSVYGRNVLGASVLETLPESARYTFPFIYSLINERTTADLDKAYLNTISFNRQPKQWFVMKNIEDKDGKLWMDILMRGPYNEKLKSPVEEVARTVGRIFSDLNGSGDHRILKRLNTYMEKGQSSCELVKYTPGKI